MSRRRNKYYDRKLKLQAVQDYFGGGGSLRTICKKHGIKDKKQLRNWIKWYNGHKEIKERRAAGTEIYMTKGRKTTEKERAEIVAFCIEHGKNYPLTIKTYGVSYQLWRIVSTDLRMGTKVRRKRRCRSGGWQRQEQAGE